MDEDDIIFVIGSNKLCLQSCNRIAGPGATKINASRQLFVPGEPIIRDLRHICNGNKRKLSKARGKLHRCQTLRSDVKLTAETIRSYLTSNKML